MFITILLLPWMDELGNEIENPRYRDTSEMSYLIMRDKLFSMVEPIKDGK
jgi:hypothetical protein